MKLLEVCPRVLCALAITCLAMPMMAAKPGPSTQTGQGIDIELKASGTFAAHETDTYHYNEGTAATYFTNTFTSGPAINCTGGGPNGANCDGSNQPSPSAPAPDPAEVNAAPKGAPGAVDENKCNFLDGGALDGHTYEQSVTVNGLNGRGNWTFTWTYTVSPTVDSVPPFTAWDLVNTHGSGGVPLITIDADIMGESAMQSAKMN